MTDVEKRVRELSARLRHVSKHFPFGGMGDLKADEDAAALDALLDEVTRLRAANVYLADEMRQMRSALGDF